MIKFFAIVGLLIIEAILIASVVGYYVYKANVSDEDIATRDVELGKINEKVKQKNLIIKDLKQKNKELENENRELKKQLKRSNNKRLW